MLRRLFPLQCPSCAAWCRGVCPVCLPHFAPRSAGSVPEGLDDLWCRFAYDGAVRRLVLAAKATGSHGWLDEMATLLPRPREVIDRNVVIVTWATGSTAHHRQRGYDPAERLARPYARSLGLRSTALLRRIGGPQEGRSAIDRHALRFTCPQPITHPVVIVVDDVVTTGASLSAAASAVRGAGAHAVIGVSFAQRELHGLAVDQR